MKRHAPIPVAGTTDARPSAEDTDGVLQVFDRPMCCSTGVCGPDVDLSLVRFAADLEWLRARGVPVRRFNPAQEPGVFVRNRTVRKALEERGMDCLPLILWGDRIVMSGAFPDRAELLEAIGSDSAVGASGRTP